MLAPLRDTTSHSKLKPSRASLAPLVLHLQACSNNTITIVAPLATKLRHQSFVRPCRLGRAQSGWDVRANVRQPSSPWSQTGASVPADIAGIAIEAGRPPPGRVSAGTIASAQPD